MVDAATVIHTVGSQVWVKDDAEAWVKAEVVKVEADGLTVQMEGSGSQKKVKSEEAPLQNADTRGVEDMTRLSYLHEPGVLWNLRVRYNFDDIYTYTGGILIAINPFAALPHMYGEHMMDQYRGVDLGDLSPHVYAIADAAYKQMRKEMKGQSILVSGESGAGKTETSKLIMKYLAHMGGFNESATAQRRGSGSGRSVEEQVLESNPLLEAFGNAKTVRNNNSSRFGKYVEINFNKAGAISGAAIRTYLLERSRVVSINNPERSYHIFYQLCDGASKEERERWRLRPANEYTTLAQSSCFEIPGDSNAAEYAATVRAMAKVGIPPEQREAVLRTVAAILHLGNITFSPTRDDASSVQTGPGSQALAAAAYLLGVDTNGLERALTTRTRQTPEGPIVSPLNVRAAAEARDALSKVVYSKLFDWLVAAINAAIGEDKNAAASVGVLDIYGFESFEYNDLEQFCINLANEKLQQHFNQHVFKQEQAEYTREAIDWSYIEFVDNQDVLDLIEGRMGVLDLLDEQCRFPTATHKDLAEKLYGSDVCKASGRFRRPKLAQTAFTLEHYAGPVTYQTDNFLEKNKDFVVAEHQALLQGSHHSFVRELFPPPEPDLSNDSKGPKRSYAAFKFNSVGSQFKKQLSELMVKLHSMEPHYIRCIKPNSINKPSVFENANVLHQLRCGGVLEAVRISCAGFPSKRTYEDFVDRFWPLQPALYQSPGLDDRAIAEGILKHSGIGGYQLGKTKVFLRAGQMAVLDKQRTDTLARAATSIQRRARGMLARSHYATARDAVLALQCGVRGMLARKQARGLRRERAATVVQTAWRRQRMQRQYKAVLELVVRVQALYRGRLARTRFAHMRRESAALTIQTMWRMRQARRAFVAHRDAASVLQRLFRCRVARKELLHLRAEAREAGKLLEDKKQLETKLKDIQNTLEVVQNQRNELRQEVKDAKAALAEAERRAAQNAQEREAAVADARRQTAEEAAAGAAAASAAEGQVGALQAELAAAKAAAASERAELEKRLRVAQDYIQRLMAEKSDIDKRFHGMKDELIQRLQNACAQRDEARAQVMELDARLQKAAADHTAAREQMKQQAIAMAAAAAAAPAAPQPPTIHSVPIDANGTDMLNSVRKGASGLVQSLAQAPGYARMVADAANSYLNAPGTGAPGAPAPSGAENMPPAAAGASPGPARPQTVSGPSGQPETELERKTRELQAKQQQLMLERRKQEEERLLSSLGSDLGFHRGKPLAALITFRACLQWRAFQADRTSIFDRIIQVIGGQIERQQDDNRCLAYWLTNTVTLLHLLQRNIKPASGSASFKGRATAAGRSMLGGLFGRAPLAGEASIHGGGVGGFRLVEAKYPALLFKQQLDAFVQKIFPMMRDNVKKAVTPLLSNCIHTPKGSHSRGAHPRRSHSGDHSAATAAAAGERSFWKDILTVFSELLGTLQANNVPRPLVQALFKQLFSFMNVQLFNQLLLRRECCSFSNGEYVKTGLASVEAWISEAGPENVGDSWDELKYIRQAVTFLVIGNKPRKALEDITRDLCPVLSIQQLYRISTMYWDDKYNTETVSGEVLGAMKQQMVENSSSASHSFLLDDDSTLPFSAPDILAQMDDKDLYVALPVPKPLQDADGGGSFSFLEKELRFSQM